VPEGALLQAILQEMYRPALLLLLVVTMASLSGVVRAEVAIPEFGRRGELPEGLTSTFSTQLRQAVSQLGLQVDPAELVTEGIAGSLDPFYTSLAARLLGTRYAVSGEVAESATSGSRFTVNMLIVDTATDRHSDLISHSLSLQDLSSVAAELAQEILAFTDQAAALPAGDAGLFISSEPAGATVFVNGRQVGRTGELDLLQLVPGRYQIEVRLEGHLPVSRVEELRPGSTSFPHFRLTEIRGGSAQVSSRPAAEVLSGGESFGMTPLSIPLPAGRQQLVLRRDGFRDSVVTVDILNNRVTRTAVDLVAVREPLVFWDEEDGVSILVDGEPQTGLAATSLRPGRVTFTVRRSGLSMDHTVVLPLTGVFRLDTRAGTLVPFPN